MGFNKIISQNKALKILKGTILTNRIPNAFLFIGEPYVGKTTTAILYAKAINCQKPENFSSCDSCDSCIKIEKGLHPDVRVVVPDKNFITVDVIRDIEEFLSYRNLEGKYKVAIIKQADRMNESAANAFLKTVEEPPSNTTIILTCENPYSLPEPLVSRCFKIYFSPLSSEECKKLIPDSPDKDFLLKISMGKPGLIFSKDMIKEKKWFFSLMQEIIGGSKKALWKDNEEIKWSFDLIFIMLRDVIINKFIKNYNPVQILDFSDVRLKEDIKLEDIIAIYDELQEIKRSIDLNLNKSILWNYTGTLLRRLINA